jgi:hypothetical protein
MKILILATPRSGSTSLAKFIDSHLRLPDYKMFIEPYAIRNHKDYSDKFDCETTDLLLSHDNILVKNLILVGYDEYPTKTFNNVHEYLEWCGNFFDKIIILDRKNKTAQAESFVINETMARERGIGWHTPKIYDMRKIQPTYIQTMINRYNESSEILYNFSQNKKYQLFYYEDIFEKYDKDITNDLFEYLGLELNETHYKECILSPNRRVRIEKGPIKLI